MPEGSPTFFPRSPCKFEVVPSSCDEAPGFIRATETEPRCSKVYSVSHHVLLHVEHSGVACPHKLPRPTKDDQAVTVAGTPLAI